MREEAHRIRKHLKKAPKAAPPSQPQGVHPPRTESPEPMTPLEGIWELHGERPPPSSIAARKDTVSSSRRETGLDAVAESFSLHSRKLASLHTLWTSGTASFTPFISGARRVPFPSFHPGTLLTASPQVQEISTLSHRKDTDTEAVSER